MKSSSDEPTIFISAGEVSGDYLGAGLMNQLKTQYPAAQFIGIGGTKMQEEGLFSLFPMHELSVMGFFEVLPHIYAIKCRIDQTIKLIQEQKPSLIITIDSPGFHFRLVRRLRKQMKSVPPCLHYVAPSVWAWKEKRAKKMKPLYDHLLTLFPFEPPYFTKHGLKATFVGHPLVDELGKTSSGEDVKAFRKKHGILPDVPILCVLPGSRRGEIDRLWPVFEEAISLLSRYIRRLHIVLPTLPQFHEKLAHASQVWPFPVTVTSNNQEKRAAFQSATLALAASGTVALELALDKVPMVVAYKVNKLTGWVVKKLIKVPHVSLVNILLGRFLVPEMLQNDCTPELLAEKLMDLLLHKKERQKQIEGMKDIAPILSFNAQAPSLNAARVAASYLKGNPLKKPI